MELKEAIEILKCLYSENADLLSKAFVFEEETIYIDEELAEEFLLDNEAIDTVLETLEKLQKENEELKAKQVTQEFKIDWCEKNTVSKDKIKEKIEEVKSRECDDVFDLKAFMYEQKVIIKELEELLKGE